MSRPTADFFLFPSESEIGKYGTFLFRFESGKGNSYFTNTVDSPLAEFPGFYPDGVFFYQELTF